jgi:tetratricopeptide (TPR) repeat protein
MVHRRRSPVVGLIFAALLICPISRSESSGPGPLIMSQASSETFTPEQLGDIHLARQEYQLAIESYQSGPQNSPAVWTKIGIAYQHLRATDQAKSDYEKALAISHDYPDALNNLGTVFFEQRSFRQAEKLFKRAIKLAPNNAGALRNLGTAYFAEGRTAKGAEAYLAAFRADPASFDRDRPEDVAEPTLRDQPTQLYYSLAELYAKFKEDGQAIDYLRKAIDAGFHDRRRILADQNFAELKNTDAFTRLMEETKIR